MVSTAKVAEALKGLDFPTDKRQCVTYAMKHRAPENVVDALQRMPDDRYDSMSDVWHAIGQIE